jgi:integrase
LPQFKDWLLVVKQYSPVTARGYVKIVKTALHAMPTFDYDHILAYLKERRAHITPGHYAKVLGALKAYSRFLGMPDLLSDFSFPQRQFKPKPFWSREQIASFYNALTTLRMKALFLMGATTGLRKGELLSLRVDDIDFSTRTVIPKVHSGRTKHSWVSFYNEECEHALRQHIAAMRPATKAKGKLFAESCRDFKVEWRAAKERSGVPLKFKDLRDYFAESMISLGVQTIYIDAMAGRAPASVLAKHYVDLSPQKLKQVYDQAGLTVLISGLRERRPIIPS